MDILLREMFVRGQRRVLLAPRTDLGKRYLQNNFISTSELVSICLDNHDDVEKLISEFEENGILVEVI